MNKVISLILTNIIITSCVIDHVLYVSPSNSSTYVEGGQSTSTDSESSSLATIDLKARSRIENEGHTIRVDSIRISAGENLNLMLDSTVFNRAAYALPHEYTSLVDEELLPLVDPLDIDSLSIEADYRIMDGNTIILEDQIRFMVEATLKVGKTYEVRIDITPKPITFDASVNPYN